MTKNFRFFLLILGRLDVDLGYGNLGELGLVWVCEDLIPVLIRGSKETAVRRPRTGQHSSSHVL